jgi:transglutaminase/protease-like cytokinesis protein 3
MSQDAFGPSGFYGELDLSIKAPLIADQYRVDICLRCQRGDIKFDHLDTAARNCPEFPTIDQVVQHLVSLAPTELEKTRIIFTWIATHIRYDWDGYRTGNLFDSGSSETVFAKRMGVCAGYSLLFNRMATQAGIKSYCVSGVAPGLCPTSPPAAHAWNAVLIEGEMVRKFYN